MATDDLGGNDESVNSRMASWPKWATDQSMKELAAAISGSNKNLRELTKQVTDLLREQRGSTKKEASTTTSRAQQTQQSARVSGAKIGANSRPQDLFNKRLTDAISVGISNLAGQQSRANALLRNINQNLSPGKTSSTREKMREQLDQRDNSTQADARESKAKAGANTRSQDIFSRRLADALDTGFTSLAAQQSRANALLRNINQNLSSGRTSSARESIREQINQRANVGLGGGRRNRRGYQDRRDHDDYDDYFSGGITRKMRRFRVDEDKEKYADETTQRVRRTLKDGTYNMRGMSAAEQKAAAQELSESLRRTFGNVLDPAIKKFGKEVDEAKGDMDKLRKAFQDLGKAVESDATQMAKRPGENNAEYFRRISTTLGEQQKKSSNSFTGILESVGGALVSFFGPKSVMGMGLALLTTRIGLLAGIAKTLFDMWRNGAVQTTEALMKGLDGLTTGGVLSFAIAAKSAGLTVEQFSKALDAAGGMANLLDENIRNTGQAFSRGINNYLDAASQANYFGQSFEELNRTFGRQVRIVAQTGLRGDKAIQMATDRALAEADEVRRLSVMTGRSVADINSAFDELYNNEIFRMATTRMLANNEKKAAEQALGLGKTLASIGGDFAKRLEDELGLSSLGGFDPNVIGGAFSQLEVLAPQLAEAMRQSQNLPESERRAAVAQAAQNIPREQLRTLAAAAINDPEMRSVLGFIQRSAESRTEAPERGGPTTEGARQAARSQDLDRTIQRIEGEFMRGVQASGVMKAMTGLAQAATAVTNAFLGLPEAVRNVIELAGAAAALLFALGGIGAFKALGRGLASAARRGGFGGGRGRGAGSTPPSEPTPPSGPRGGPGAAAAEGAAGRAAGAAAAEGAAAVEGAAAGAKTPKTPAVAEETPPRPQPGKIQPTEEPRAPRPPVANDNVPKPVETPKPAETPRVPGTPETPRAPAAPPETPRVPGTPETPRAPTAPPETPRVTGTPVAPVEPPKPVETPRVPGTPETPRANVPAPAEPPRPPSMPGEPPPPAGSGTGSRMSGVASAVKNVAREVRGSGILGAVIGVGINELTDVQDLRRAREQVIEKYRAGEITRKDAQDALKEIDDKIAESRGGSLARGGVSGVGGALGAIGVGALGSVVPGAGTAAGGVVGGIAGAEITDRLFGGAAERAGGWISRQLFGGSDRSANRDLDAADENQLGTPLRGQGFRRDGELSEKQVALLDKQLSTGLSMEQIGMPGWLQEKYKKKKKDQYLQTAKATGYQQTDKATGMDAMSGGASADLAIYAPGVARAIKDSAGRDPAESTAAVRKAAQAMSDKEISAIAQLAGPGGDEKAKSVLAFIQKARTGSADSTSNATPAAQPGKLTSASTSFRIAGKDVMQGQDLTPDQMTAIGMALNMNPENAKNYPSWVMDQYKKQKGTTTSQNSKTGVDTSMLAGATPAAASIGLTPNQPQTPNGITGAGAAVANVAGAAPGATSQMSSEEVQARRNTAVAESTKTDSQKLVELQQQNNMLLSRLVDQNGAITGDSRRQVDLLENINNKT